MQRTTDPVQQLQPLHLRLGNNMEERPEKFWEPDDQDRGRIWEEMCVGWRVIKIDYMKSSKS